MERAKLTLFEGVLNDDHLIILEDNYYYKGHNKATCKLVYYTFATEWSNKEHKMFFKSIDNALEWYKKHLLDRVIMQGKEWAEDGGEPAKDDTEAINEWENCTLYCEIY